MIGCPPRIACARVALAAIVQSMCCAAALADGGQVRAAARCGDWQVTVFTSPTPLRAGPIDVSLFVQDAAGGEPANVERVEIVATHAQRPELVLCSPATTAAATNKLLHAAKFDLPSDGPWRFVARVVDHQGSDHEVAFAATALGPASWRVVAPWMAGSAAIALLYGLGVIARATPPGRSPARAA